MYFSFLAEPNWKKKKKKDVSGCQFLQREGPQGQDVPSMVGEVSDHKREVRECSESFSRL